MDETYRDDIFAELEFLASTIVPSGKPVERLESGERRNVTILFLHVGGEAEKDKLQQINEKLLAVFDRVVQKHGGYVDKHFADGLMALFGAKKATGRDASVAVACALEIQSRMKAANEVLSQAGMELGVRTGINTGEVAVGGVGAEREEDFTAYGDAVNTAKRFETACQYGEIYIGSSSRELTGTAFEYVDAGMLELKGKAEPVQAWAVTGRPETRTRRWEREAPVTLREVFAGRNEELAFLAEIVDKAAARPANEKVPRMTPGAPKAIVAVVRGEAGIGKSRLLAEFKRGSSDIVQIRGEAVRSGGLPFQVIASALCRWAATVPLREDSGEKVKTALNELLSRTETPDEKNALAENIDRICYLAGNSSAGESIEGLDEKNLSTALMLAFRSFIEAVAPAALVIDDFQWADDPSIGILYNSLASLNSHIPVATIVLSRPEWNTPGDWAKEFELSELELKGLSESDSEAQVKGLLGEGVEIPQSEKEWLTNRAQGNPFYLEEIVLAAIRAGAFVEEGGKWKSTDTLETVGLPPTLDELILGHLDSVEDGLRVLMQRAAVVGQPFWANILSHIYRALKERDEVTPPLQELAEDAFIYAGESSGSPHLQPGTESREPVSDLPYFFRHILLKEGAYKMLLKLNRRVLHRFAALAIEELYEGSLPPFYDALAGHWEMAAEPLKAARYVSKSVDATGENLRPEIRISECGRALGMLEGIDEPASESDIQKERVGLLLLRGTAYRTSGDMKDALTDYKKALGISRETGDKSGIARSFNNIGTAYWSLGEYMKAKEYHEDSLVIFREIGDKSGTAKSLNNIGAAHCSLSDYQESKRLREESLGISREIDDKAMIANNLSNIGNVHWALGDCQKAMEYYEDSIAIEREIGNKSGTATDLGNIALVLYSLGDYAKTMECSVESLGLFREIGDRGGIAWSLNNIGNAYSGLGDYRNVVKHAEDALAILREIGEKNGIAWSLFNIGSAYINLGDSAKAMTYLEEGLVLFREMGDKGGIAWSLKDIGNACINLDEHEIAVIVLEESLGLFREIGEKSGIACSLINLGDLRRMQGDYSKAMEYFEESLEVCRDIGFPFIIADSLKGAAVTCFCTGDFLEAKKHFSESVKTCAEMGNKDFLRKLIIIGRGELAKAEEKLAAADAEPLPEDHAAALADIKALLDEIETKHLVEEE